MSASNSKQQSQAKARDLKHRVLTCLHKLSDRDTHAVAASELESIARSLSTDALPPFLSSISATDSSDKSPVRRQCVRLISVLSEHHGNSLSPHLSKLLSAIVRRLRDPDSSVRSACVSASLSLSSHLTTPSFASITKPFLESLFREQDSNTQTGAALCLVSIIEGSQNPDSGSLKRLLPRFEKLAKCESFKAKAALLTLMGSVVELNGVLNGGGNLIKNLVMCLVEFLSSEDWTARKAAAETLMKIAGADNYALSEYKSSCLKTFEAKRFDKVKAVRETMNQMIDAWKEIPDLSDEVSQSAELQASSEESPSDGRYPPGFKTSCTVSSTAPVVRKRGPFDNPVDRTPSADGSSATTARKRSPLGGNDRKIGPAMFRKLDPKKPSDWKVQIAGGSSVIDVSKDNPLTRGERVLKTVEEERNKFTKPEIKRALFNENSDEKKQKLGFFKPVSRVMPSDHESFVTVNETGVPCRNQKECEDLSLIRKQLVQIENQQSNLLDILQKFIGSSHSGMRSLETRVHGLELALDEISFDLAVSTGRMSRSDAAGAMCCKLPGAEFLSSKLWKKTEGHFSTSRFSDSDGNTSVAGVRNIPDKNGDREGFKLENRRYRLQGGRGFIVNPLAETPRRSLQIPEVSASGVIRNIPA
ncbi:TORTIFOLIA1-like protein 4 [Olea europaea var. sylvestris]|uniref:TORTIFOLIA1-like protein 4 n=1 Tax=Olea europaea var. sylvestris TaxID=158386 RepID=UPI000C1D0382|nr:TORTIFOLIA1-like protein 4 [Olea europaea var. sylvestris]